MNFSVDNASGSGSLSVSSQIFSSIDSLDSLLGLFELLDMALEYVESSSESDTRVSLLITSFLLRAEPSLEEIVSDLKSVYWQLKSQS